MSARSKEASKQTRKISIWKKTSSLQAFSQIMLHNIPDARNVVTGSGHGYPDSLLTLSRRGPLMCLYTCVVYIRNARTSPPLQDYDTCIYDDSFLHTCMHVWYTHVHVPVNLL